jgi:hypothetical protein
MPSRVTDPKVRIGAGKTVVLPRLSGAHVSTAAKEWRKSDPDWQLIATRILAQAVKEIWRVARSTLRWRAAQRVTADAFSSARTGNNKCG